MTEQRGDDRATGAAVDAAWRQAASEQPPAETDAAILAAARAAVRRDAKERLPAPPPRRRASWQPLAAAAGVIGLSFLLVPLLPRDRLARPPADQGAPRAPAAESAPTFTPPPPATGDAASVVSEEREATAGAAPSAAMEAAARQSLAARPASPEAWASRIASLHDAGDLAAAAAELRSFRAVHADADRILPGRLREWAASVGPEGTP